MYCQLSCMVSSASTGSPSKVILSRPLNHVMRFMRNHRLLDHIKIDDLLISVTTLVPIMSIIKSKTLELYGHIKRSMSGLSKICIEGMISGKRSTGRQNRRWRDNVYEWSRLHLSPLNKITQTRNRWKQHTHLNEQSAIAVIRVS